MQNLRIVISAFILFARIVLGNSFSFTEPPVDSPDYTRTYGLGQTVFVSWNQSASDWPLVQLRLDPVSATNAPEYGVTYATLISLSLAIYISLHSCRTILTAFGT
jgi:hypothetical protein